MEYELNISEGTLEASFGTLIVFWNKITFTWILTTKIAIFPMTIMEDSASWIQQPAASRSAFNIMSSMRWDSHKTESYWKWKYGPSIPVMVPFTGNWYRNKRARLPSLLDRFVELSSYSISKHWKVKITAPVNFTFYCSLYKCSCNHCFTSISASQSQEELVPTR